MIDITTDYLASQGLSETFPTRFWTKVKKTDFCWLWTASPYGGRYGRISRTGKSRPTKGRDISSHVAAWILIKGPVPKGMCVLHHCDNPRCVNPDHLWIGTQLENMRDMVKKRRARGCRGESHANHKLTSSDVASIRSLKLSGHTGVELAKRFGVTPAQISNIVLNKQWFYPNP